MWEEEHLFMWLRGICISVFCVFIPLACFSVGFWSSASLFLEALYILGCVEASTAHPQVQLFARNNHRAWGEGTLQKQPRTEACGQSLGETRSKCLESFLSGIAQTSSVTIQL